MTDVLDDQLAQWLDALAPDWEPEAEPDVAKLVGVLRALEREDARDKALVDDQVAVLRSWQYDREEARGSRRAHIERLLEGWARARYEETGGRVKTSKFPAGDLKIRKAQPRVSVSSGTREDVAAEALVGRFDEMVRVKYELARKTIAEMTEPGPPIKGYDEVTYGGEDGYRAHAAVAVATGEVLPGIVILVPTREAFQVTLLKDYQQ